MFVRRCASTFNKAAAAAAATRGRNVKTLQIELNHKFTQLNSTSQVSELILQTPVDLFSGINCATAFTALSRTKSTDKFAINHVLQACNQQLDPGALSSICYSFAAADPHLAPQLPPKIVNEVLQSIDKFTKPQDLANLAWAFAKFNCQMPRLFKKLTAQAKLCLAEFKPQEMSNLIWACAKLDFYDQELCQHIAQHVITSKSLITEFSTQALVNILWAFATLNYRNEESMRVICHTLLLRGDELSSQGRSNMMWSLATLDFHLLEVCRFVESTPNLSTFTLQGLVNTVWALAKFEHFSKFDRFGREVNKRRIDTVHALASLLYAFCKPEKPHVELCSKLYKQLLKHDLQTFSPLDYSNILWCLARLHASSPSSFSCEPICKALTRGDNKLNKFTPHHIGVILGALARLQYLDRELMQALSTTLLAAGGKLTAQECSIAMHSFAVLNCHGKASSLLYDHIAALACERGLREFSSQDVVQLMWAFACLDLLHRPNVQALFQLECDHVPVIKSVATAQQLFQCRLAWGKHTSALLDHFEQDDGWVNTTVQQENANANHKSSRAHIAAFTMMKMHLPLLKFEHTVHDVSVDMFVSPNIVIEVDGPYHFFTNAPNIPHGNTMFKQRLLERLGYKVYSIPTMWFHQMDMSARRKALQELARHILSQQTNL